MTAIIYFLIYGVINVNFITSKVLYEYMYVFSSFSIIFKN